MVEDGSCPTLAAFCNFAVVCPKSPNKFSVHPHSPEPVMMKTALASRSDLHFIRCVKSNEEAKSHQFDPATVLTQLQNCGVMEVTRIARAGFPTRFSYQDFLANFNKLLRYTGEDEEALHQELCKKALSSVRYVTNACTDVSSNSYRIIL